MPGTLTITTLSDGTNSTSATNCISGSAKAWVNFNGVTTASIRASYNVSSVTRTATGIYTVAFTSAFADTNYAVIGSARVLGAASIFMPYPDNVLTTSSVSVYSLVSNTGSGADGTYVYVAIFR
jgi:hypothetical protein